MNKNKTANKNPANYHLYHALMEALIADEDVMDKEVKDRVKNHKRKHANDDDEDDDDDEGPSAGSNQGKLAKRRRHDSGASGSAQPPTKDDEKSSKKPRESDVFASKQHPTLTSTGWQITDIRDDVVDSSMHRSDPKSEHSEQSSEDIPIRTGKKKLSKADLEGPTFNLVKAVHKNNVFLQFQMDECHKLLTNKVDLVNPEGHQILALLIITGGLEERNSTSTNTIVLRRADYKEYKILEKDFKNLHPNDFEDLFLLNIQEKLNHLPKTDKTSLHTAVNMWIRNLVIKNRVGDLQLGIESYQTKINLERPNWDAADYYFKEDYTIVPKPRAVVYRDRNDQRKLMRLNELHKFSDGTLTRVMENQDHMVKDFHLFEYNKGMETRKWSEDDKRRSKDFITAIEKRLQIKRIFRSLESFVGGRIRDIDYRLINRTT
ncbi:hypothetical protein Tco_0237903 [Tanacetum coccineum]